MAEAWEIAIQSDRDPIPYQADRMEEYGQEFLSQIGPHFAHDMVENYEWYLANRNEVLLNVMYPSQLEQNFLKHIEQVQQRKNDQKYRAILKSLENGKNTKSSSSKMEDLQRMSS